VAAALALTLASAAPILAQDSTSTLHYKGISLSPIGFSAAEAVWRQRNITADIGSSYNAIPFDNTSAANTSEFRATGRQSRIGLLAEGKANNNKVTGYWEADFLGVGTASNSNESNSYVLRVRQYFGSVTTPDKLTFAAGQMWSLLTTSKTGALPRAEAVPLTIEAQYAVGFNWARQPGFRVVKTSGATTLAFALEGAQTTYSARNAPANILVGQAGGSLLNGTTNYSTDVAPDAIAKLAFDPAGLGHWELKAVASELRDRFVDPAGTAGGTRMQTTMAGGVGFGIVYPVMSGKRDLVDLGLSGLYGKGIGRYGTSQLPDATVNAKGALEPITAAHTLLSIEAHPTSQLDVYGYGGVEYADRTAFVNAAGKGVGYGSPLNSNAGCTTEAVPGGPYAPASGSPCTADTRDMWQGDLGFWYRFYKGAAGTVQWGAQVSHTRRDTWSGLGSQPSGTDNMVFTSFRYVLP
jgi:hypothetical protein